MCDICDQTIAADNTTNDATEDFDFITIIRNTVQKIVELFKTIMRFFGIDL